MSRFRFKTPGEQEARDFVVERIEPATVRNEPGTVFGVNDQDRGGTRSPLRAVLDVYLRPVNRRTR